jgi:hypothetical protein
MDDKALIALDQVWAEAQKNRRVCPQPRKWQELYEMLPNKRRLGNGWEPSVPLILAAWWTTPALAKMLRLREHVEWAEKQGCLEAVFNYLAALQENEWHHLGD